MGAASGQGSLGTERRSPGPDRGSLLVRGRSGRQRRARPARRAPHSVGAPAWASDNSMTRINVLWVINHVCYDGSLHGGGRLYWNVLQHFEDSRIRVAPYLLRATEEIRRVFRDSPVPVRVLDKGKFDPATLWTFLRLIRENDIHVMHLHCYGASTFGRLASALTGVPAVIHDYDTEVYFPYPWYLRLADRALASRTDRAIAPSPK